MAIDENAALWVLYHYEKEEYLVASELDLRNLTIKRTWNLTLINHTKVANGFVICGVLYLVRSGFHLQSEIYIAYDFYRNRYRHPDVKWINLYKNTNMVSYNRFDKRIYIYDHGYLLTVPARIKWRV